MACYCTTGHPNTVETIFHLVTSNAFAEAEKEGKTKNVEKTPFFACSSHVFGATCLNNDPNLSHLAADFTGVVSQQPFSAFAATRPPDVQPPSRGGGYQ